MTVFSLDPAGMPEGYGEAVLSLAQAKAHLRVDTSDEDDLIAALRDAAVELVEQYCSIPLQPRTGLVWRGGAGCFAGGGAVRLGLHPVISVASIVAVDASGADVSADPADFRTGPHDLLTAKPGKSWPDSSGGATIIFSAGLADAPAGLVSAVRLMLGHLYENREAMIDGTATGEIPLGVTWHCSRYRMPVL